MTCHSRIDNRRATELREAPKRFYAWFWSNDIADWDLVPVWAADAGEAEQKARAERGYGRTFRQMHSREWDAVNLNGEIKLRAALDHEVVRLAEQRPARAPVTAKDHEAIFASVIDVKETV